MREIRRAVVLVTVATMVVLAGCGDSDDGDEAADTSTGSAEELNTVVITEDEYSYRVSGELQEGWTTLDVRNEGDEYHMVGLGRMKEGVTIDDVREVLSQFGEEDGEEPEEESLGEVQLISAQSETTTTVDEGEEVDGEGEGEDGDPFEALFQEEIGAPGHILAPGAAAAYTTEFLEAGEYALICFIPTDDGTPHFAEGMLDTLTVEEADDPVGEPPAADEIVTIASESIELAEELEAGETTFEVSMEGDEDHELAIVRLNDEDATFEEVDAFFDQFEEGPPPTRDELEEGPGVLTVFTFDVAAPASYSVTVDLEPGTYFIGCALDESLEGEEGGRDHGQTEHAKVTVT